MISVALVPLIYPVMDFSNIKNEITHINGRIDGLTKFASATIQPPLKVIEFNATSKIEDNSTQNISQENNAISYDVTRLGELQAFHDNLFNDLDRLLFSQIM